MHVGDIGDVKYLNKRSKATLYTVLVMSEMLEYAKYLNKRSKATLYTAMLLMSEMLEMVFVAFMQMCTDQLLILFNIFNTFDIHTWFCS